MGPPDKLASARRRQEPASVRRAHGWHNYKARPHLDFPASFFDPLSPALLAHGSAMLYYLAPAALLAVLIRVLASVHPFFFLFTLAGTVCHELAHVIVGFLTGARPGAITVIPKRKGRHWELGSVTLNRLRWYNAIPAALAPLLIILIPIGVAWWRTATPHWRYEAQDILLAFVLAPQFLSFLPSKDDWRIAAHGWPLLMILAFLAWLAWYF